MSAILLVLTFPLWRIWVIPRGQDSRRGKLVVLILLAPLFSAGIWWFCVPVRFDRSDYKTGVLAADDAENKSPIVFQNVMWPPIAYALDEYDLAGKAAAPPWYPQPSKAESKEPRKAASRWNTPHWLGTDESGRDVLCRMIWGGRVSLSVGIVAVAIYVSIGIVVGAIAGYFRGVCDLILSRIIEVVICFPSFFLILTIVAMVGPGLLNIMVVIGLTGWTGIARLVRGEFLRLVDQEFVLAGRALGYTPLRLIFRHVLPNAMAPVLVSATFGVAGAILTESALSFLGLGISKPTPSWGSLLADGREALDHAPWLIHFPGLAIFITITAYNLIGEALRDAADPRLRGSR
jgi:peptide/nickel transport system permease protein